MSKARLKPETCSKYNRSNNHYRTHESMQELYISTLIDTTYARFNLRPINGTGQTGLFIEVIKL